MFRFCRWTRALSTPAARASRKNPDYFDAENIVKLAVEGGCNGVASTYGVLGAVSRKYAHKNSVHCEDQPQRTAHVSEQVRSNHVRHDQTGGGHGRGGGRRDDLFRLPTRAGGRLSRWPRRSPRHMRWDSPPCCGATCAAARFKIKGADGKSIDYHVSTDLTGQANHLGVTLQADIIKQKLPENNGGFQALKPSGRLKLRQIRRADLHRADQRSSD